MYPSRFRYEAPRSLGEAISLLTEGGDEAKVMAGGQSLVPLMKLRFASPELIVDINNIGGLDYHRADADGTLRIGALCRHAELEHSDLLKGTQPTMAAAAPLIADPLVRNRGTIGGSLCQADPSEDLSAVFAAVRATAVIRGQDGDREVPVREFHLGPYETVIGPGELLAEIRVPVQAGAGSAYEKVARRVGDWSVAAAGVALWLDKGIVKQVGIGLTAVAAEHFVAAEAEEFLRGKPATEENFEKAAKIAAEHCQPIPDQRGPEDYKRHLVAELTTRALRRAAGRAAARATS